MQLEVIVKKIFLGVFFAGIGFWIGANRLLPLWLIVVLGVIGAVTWCVAEWMERREGHRDDEG